LWNLLEEDKIMSRSRNIKPGLWLNEDLAECSMAARYLFPGLWCLADKDGRIEYRPQRIKAQIFPYDKICISSLVGELHGKKFISVYEYEGELFIQINNFLKHQNPHPKEKRLGYPEPVNICEYDGNLKQFNFTASRVEIPFPSSSLIPSSLIPYSVPKVPFERFYILYPKKKAKEAAKKVWDKMKVDELLFAKIVTSLEAQKLTDDWLNDDGKYIPLPSTWLNGKRWEDEIEICIDHKDEKTYVLPDLEKLAAEKRAAKERENIQ
jgi:hypothetical protein